VIQYSRNILGGVELIRYLGGYLEDGDFLEDEDKA